MEAAYDRATVITEGPSKVVGLEDKVARAADDSEGNLIDEGIRELLRKHLEKFSNWCARLLWPRQFVGHGCEMDIASALA